MGINWLPSPASYIFALTRPRRRRRGSALNDVAEFTQWVEARRRHKQADEQYRRKMEEIRAEREAKREAAKVIDLTVWEVITANQVRVGDTIRLSLDDEGWGPERYISTPPRPAGPTSPYGISIPYWCGWPTVHCEASVLRKLPTVDACGHQAWRPPLPYCGHSDCVNFRPKELGKW